MTDRRRWRSRRPGPQNHHTIARGRAAEFLARPAPTGAMHPPGGRASARAPHCSAAYVFLSRRCRRLLPFEMLQCKLSSRRRGARFGGRGCWGLSGSKCARVVARQVWRRQLKHDLWAGGRLRALGSNAPAAARWAAPPWRAPPQGGACHAFYLHMGGGGRQRTAARRNGVGWLVQMNAGELTSSRRPFALARPPPRPRPLAKQRAPCSPTLTSPAPFPLSLDSRARPAPRR